MIAISSILLCLSLNFAVLDSKLVIDERFQGQLSASWMTHINGRTGIVKIVNSSEIPENENIQPGNYLFTNITECGENHCYRAEAAYGESNNIAGSRVKVIPDCRSEYWLGTSIYLPKSWTYTQTNDTVFSTAYHLQLHGGENAGNNPVLALKQVNDHYVISICGNTERNSQLQCIDKYGGRTAVGQWEDFVFHGKLSYGANADGFLQVWRNGKLIVNEYNIITAYNETKPPYVILGSYQINWKVYETKDIGYNWVACYHKALRLGLASSSYAEVFTGAANSAVPTSALNNSNFAVHLWAIIPLTILGAFSIVLMISSIVLRRNIRKLHNDRRFEDPYANSLLFKQAEFNITTENTEERNTIANFLPFSVFQHDSLFRTVFWTFFSYFVILLVLVAAAVAYGIPSLNKYSLALSGVIPSQTFRNWNILKVTMLAISGTMTAIYFLPLYYLRHNFQAGREWKNNPHFLKRIGVVIPCHKSANEIGEVLRRVLKYFPAENIIVCDNGNSLFPPDKTFEVVKIMDPHIRYLYIQQGHKTRALWTGVHRLPAHVEYIIHLDDDTHFDEENMVFDENHFNEENVIAVSFLRRCYPHNIVTKLTDFWYKVTDHFHATQARIATRCFVPGPAGLWKRDKFIEVFGKHPTLPFGEDIFGGFTALNSGYAIRTETRCMTTFAPDILFPWFVNPMTARVQGYGASSLWKQRADRWTLSAFRITGKSLYSFFTYDTKLGIYSNFAFRLYRFREYKLIVGQLLFIPILIVFMTRGLYGELLVLKALLFILPLTRNVYVNYICWRKQPELQIPWFVVLLSPLYNYFLIICAIHGRWKCVLWYLPWVAPNHGMLQRCRPQSIKSIPFAGTDPLIALEEGNETVSTPSIEEVETIRLQFSSQLQLYYKGNDKVSFELFSSTNGKSKIINYYDFKGIMGYDTIWNCQSLQNFSPENLEDSSLHEDIDESELIEYPVIHFEPPKQQQQLFDEGPSVVSTEKAHFVPFESNSLDHLNASASTTLPDDSSFSSSMGYSQEEENLNNNELMVYPQFFDIYSTSFAPSPYNSSSSVGKSKSFEMEDHLPQPKFIILKGISMDEKIQEIENMKSVSFSIDEYDYVPSPSPFASSSVLPSSPPLPHPSSRNSRKYSSSRKPSSSSKYLKKDKSFHQLPPKSRLHYQQFFQHPPSRNEWNGIEERKVFTL